jgi:hypothetical protein
MPEEPAKRRVAVTDLRSTLSRMRSGRHPDVPLSTVTELALALGWDPVSVLSHERSRQLDRVADAARAQAGKKRGK